MLSNVKIVGKIVYICIIQIYERNQRCISPVHNKVHPYVYIYLYIDIYLKKWNIVVTM